MKAIKVFLFCVTAIFLYSCDNGDYEMVTIATPITQSLEDFRASVQMMDAQSIQESGKIYSYGNYILVGDKNRGIHVIDNQDPSNPQKKNFIKIPLNNDMSVKNNILYADSGRDLVVFDLSDIERIVQLDRINDVLNNYIEYPTVDRYNFENYNYDHIIVGWDIESRLVPKEEDDIMLFQEDFANATGQGGSLARFKITGDHLYAVDNSLLNVFDISTLESPVKVGDQYVTWNAETIFEANNHLFIGSTTGMFVYDISNAASPTYVSQFDHATFCDPVVVDGDYAYVTLRAGNECPGLINLGPQLESQLNIIDIATIETPTLRATYFLDEPYGLGIKDEKLFICDGNSGLKVYDKTDVDDLTLIDHFPNVNTFDVIPLEHQLVMIGNNVLYQYNYANNGLELLSQFSLN
ncbi:LVIVD repeat-containing protein [Sungkyunkwania multivorans]|uniref:LVIVD repeat-containing protein n=1 Tax=Sungkyunkwania multivorans TaxID=1173618 RepID=A0ABW3D2G2_9FLAO